MNASLVNDLKSTTLGIYGVVASRVHSTIVQPASHAKQAQPLTATLWFFLKDDFFSF